MPQRFFLTTRRFGIRRITVGLRSPAIVKPTAGRRNIRTRTNPAVLSIGSWIPIHTAAPVISQKKVPKKSNNILIDLYSGMLICVPSGPAVIVLRESSGRFGIIRNPLLHPETIAAVCEVLVKIGVPFVVTKVTSTLL